MRSEAERAGLSTSRFVSGSKKCARPLFRIRSSHRHFTLPFSRPNGMGKSRPESLRSSGSLGKDDGEGALLLRVRGDCAPCTGGLRHRKERMQSHRGRRRPCLPDKALPASGTRDEKSPEGGSAQEPQEGRGCAQACSLKACPIQRHKRRREALLPLRGALCRLAVARGLIEGSSRLREDGGGDRGLALRQP